MWQPNKIVIKNLMTHLNTEFLFSKNECTLIFGINSTDNGSDSNGTGKSTIIEAINLAFTGETNRNIGKDEFINDNSDECEIIFDLSNEVGDIRNLTIHRKFFRKKPTKVYLFENGELNKEMTSPNEANKRIYDLIGLTKDDLLHFFIIGQETSYSFLTTNDNDKKNIISRFSDTDFINDKIESLKRNRKIQENILDSKNKEILKLETKIEYIQERISDFKEKSKNSENDIEILDFKNKIKSKEKRISLIKKDIKELKDELPKLQENFEKLVVPDITELSNSIKKINKKKSLLELEILQYEDEISHLNLIKKGKISCPKCSFEFNPSNKDIDLKKIDSNISKKNKIISKNMESLEKFKTNIKKKKVEISNIENISDEKNKIENKIRNKNRSIENHKFDIETIEEEIEKIKKKIIKLSKGNDYSSEIDDLKVQIKEIEKELNIFILDKDNVDKIILDLDFWIHHLGKKGFTTFLTNKSIKSIEGITNNYLSRMNSDLQISIDGFSVLKSGEVREKINISIIRNGLQIANFNRYSGGERARIKLANILGLQNLINLTAKNGGLNLLILDEVFEGLDRTGQIDVVNILQNLKVTSLVITHRNQPIGASNEIFIEKIKGVSKILKKNS